MALNDMGLYTQMLKSGTVKSLPIETRNVLTRRLSPSINESEAHPVRCLIFSEQDDGTCPSLWCAYGTKLKAFNVTNWICDSSDLLFPSAITCMCLDARCKLWLGCSTGEVFVVDTITRTCGEQLVRIHSEGGCQSLAFDCERNLMLIAGQNGLIIRWNASTWQPIDQMSLYETYQEKQTAHQPTFKSQATLTLSIATKPTKNEPNKKRFQPVNSNATEKYPLPGTRVRYVSHSVEQVSL
jgi:hypothetical protein